MFNMQELYQVIGVLAIIPILGAIKNVVKRKSFNIFIFLRTFIVYFSICVMGRFIIGEYWRLNLFDSMALSLLERYLMFIFKIVYSYLTKNYEKKKFKYYNKYMTELSSGSLDKMYQIDNLGVICKNCKNKIQK